MKKSLIMPGESLIKVKIADNAGRIADKSEEIADNAKRIADNSMKIADKKEESITVNL
ncbi:hypothetical protein [Lysinibacillus sp. RS5]|uniref:hypothetical protein n=1 Tax=unclassified Lysinibacillus TaxID=2636778 RepID=UPI0035BE7295